MDLIFDVLTESRNLNYHLYLHKNLLMVGPTFSCSYKCFSVFLITKKKKFLCFFNYQKKEMFLCSIFFLWATMRP